MARYFFMPKAQTFDGMTHTVPDVDQHAYRPAHEGHGSEKALRFDGFEDFATDNPLVQHEFKPDNCCKFQYLVANDMLAVGDRFVLGMIDPLFRLDFLSVEQCNTIDGLTLKITAVDGLLASVEDEGIEIDFSNAKTDPCRWDVQPVQTFGYNNHGTAASFGRSEIVWLVAEVVALPTEWLDGCSSCDIPAFSARLHYDDLCLLQGLQTCAPQDVKDAYDAAWAAITDELILWQDIPCDQSLACGCC